MSRAILQLVLLLAACGDASSVARPSTTSSGRGVVAIQVDRTEQDLAALQGEVAASLEGVVEVQGGWTDVIRGYVNLRIPVLSEENLTAIAERSPDEPICAEGLPPERLVQPGPSRGQFDGWQLIYEQKDAGMPYVTEIAWDQQSFHDLLENLDGLDEIDATSTLRTGRRLVRSGFRKQLPQHPNGRRHHRGRQDLPADRRYR